MKVLSQFPSNGFNKNMVNAHKNKFNNYYPKYLWRIHKEEKSKGTFYPNNTFQYTVCKTLSLRGDLITVELEWLGIQTTMIWRVFGWRKKIEKESRSVWAVKEDRRDDQCSGMARSPYIRKVMWMGDQRMNPWM